MKIQNTGSDPYNRLNVDGVQNVDPAAKANGTTGPAKTAAQDQAAVSEKGRALSKARAALREVPDVRAEKVAERREQVKAGQYQVNHQKLAARLMSRV